MTLQRLFSTACAVVAAAWLSLGSASAQDLISNLPRNQTLIVENPEGTIKNAGWFNIWAINAGGQSTGLHQLAMDTFWYIDPNRGVDGVWDNSLASDKPIYNNDFTEMTVKLRKGIYWSDGVEFTAADVVYTVETHLNTKGLRWSAPIQVNVASISAPDPYTVVFKLKKPNSRFHALFTVRWNAMWMMPKHIFEKAGDPLKFAFNPPVSLGPYTLNSFDPNGKWFIWQRREDWQRTTLARFGQPGPKYVAYVDAGPPDKRVIAQMNHQLDIIHDTSPEGMFTLAKQSRLSHGWFSGFPYAHPDPTLAAVIFNHAERAAEEPRRALGAGAADRHQGGVDGLVPRRGHHLGHRRAAHRHACRLLPPADRAVAEELRDRHRQAQDQAVRRDHRQADRRLAAPEPGRADPGEGRRHRQGLRHGLVEARPAGGHRAAAEGRLQEGRQPVDDARRQALRAEDHRRRRRRAR